MAKTEDFHNLSDEELVHRYRNSHDNLYVGILYRRYTHLVFGVCMKYLQHEANAQDAVMVIFEKLLQDLKKHHVEVFKPWLYTVAKNHCMMQFRRESAQQKKESSLKIEQSGRMEMPEFEHLESAEEKEMILTHLEACLIDLKEEQRVCIEGFYLKQMNYEQIMKQTGYSYNEVKSHIQNGKRNLKILITRKNEQAKN